MQNFIIYNEVGFTEIHNIYKGRKKGSIEYVSISRINKNVASYVYNHVRLASVTDFKFITKWFEWYETSQYLWVIMELCTSGTLERALAEDYYLNESLIRHYGRALTSAINYLHKMEIIYADWRPTKILITDRGVAKLFDFSYARKIDENIYDVLTNFTSEELFFSKSSISALHKKCYPYLPIEAFERDWLDFQTDIYGFGCLLYRMTFGKVPINEPNSILQYEALKNASIDFDGLVLSDSHRELLRNCLEMDCRKRYRTQDLYNHKFWRVESHIPTVKRPKFREKEVLPNRNTTFFAENPLKQQDSFDNPQSDMPTDNSKVVTGNKPGISTRGSFVLHTHGPKVQTTDDELSKSIKANEILDSPVSNGKNHNLSSESNKKQPTFDPHLNIIRGQLASKFPWGNNSLEYPEIKFISDVKPDGMGLQKEKLEDENTLKHDWTPRPIDEYGKWSKIYENVEINQKHIPKGTSFEVLNKVKIDKMTETEIEAHILVLMSIMNDMESTPASHQISLLQYTSWFISCATSLKSKKKNYLSENTANTENIGSNLIGNFFKIISKELMSYERQLRKDTILMLWFARSLSILTHKITQNFIHYYEEYLILSSIEQSEEDKSKLEPTRSDMKEMCIDFFKQVSQAIKNLIEIFTRHHKRAVLNRDYDASIILVIGELSIMQLAMHGIVSSMYYRNQIDMEKLMDIELNQLNWDYISKLLLNALNIKSKEEKLEEIQKFASKAIMNLVLTPIGCNLAQCTLKSVTSEDSDQIQKIHENFQSFIGAFAVPDVVEKLWKCASDTKEENLSVKDNCAVAVTSLINYRSGLFFSGIINKVKIDNFVESLDLSLEQNVQEKFFSLTALGLTQTMGYPKNLKNATLQQRFSKYVTSFDTFNQNHIGTQEELMKNQNFYRAIFRCFNIPHALLRAKVYIITASLISYNSSVAIPLACRMKLPGCLNRDSAGNFEESSINAYLRDCALHVHELLRVYAIPRICYEICFGIGHIEEAKKSPYSERKKKMEKWLPAYSCLSCLVTTFAQLRESLLLADEFVNQKPKLNQTPMDSESLKPNAAIRKVDLIIFLGSIINGWAQETENAAVFEAGTIENQLLSITLSIIEDIVQIKKVVCERKGHLILSILDGLSSLTKFESIQAICVKIALDMHSTWKKERMMQSIIDCSKEQTDSTPNLDNDLQVANNAIRVTSVLGLGSLLPDPNVHKIIKLGIPDKETLSLMLTLIQDLKKPYLEQESL